MCNRIQRSRRGLVSAVLIGAVVFGQEASAQSFNIDVGDDIGTPAATYAAAAAQPGPWNSATDAATVPFEITLTDIGGMATGVTTTVTSTCILCSGENSFDNGQTAGDLEALLDDFQDIGVAGSSSVWRFSGLSNGVYTVYTYAWAPDGETFITSVMPQNTAQTRTVGGMFMGTHAEGVTYSRHVVNVTNGDIVMEITPASGFGTLNGFQIVQGPDTTGTNFCFGDGGNQMGCTECRCGNNAPVGSGGGCLNSAGQSAVLIATGDPSVASDTLHFDMTGGNLNTFGILVSGDNQLPAQAANPCFGLNTGIAPLLLDGLRCTAQNEIRHGSRSTDAAGDVGFTNNGWGPPNNPMTGIIAQGGFTSGQTRHFQVFYREDDTLVCQSGQNTTNGVTVTFQP